MCIPLTPSTPLTLLYSIVFTQTTDVEAEFNGYFSYDRKVNKVSLQAIADLHKKILQKV